MRPRGALALAIYRAAIATAFAGGRPKPGHPILGSWRFVVPGGECAEIYGKKDCAGPTMPIVAFRTRAGQPLTFTSETGDSGAPSRYAMGQQLLGR